MMSVTMAMTTCPECEHNVSTSAPACPGCGYTPNRTVPRSRQSFGVRHEHGLRVVSATMAAGLLGGLSAALLLLYNPVLLLSNPVYLLACSNGCPSAVTTRVMLYGALYGALFAAAMQAATRRPGAA